MTRGAGRARAGAGGGDAAHAAVSQLADKILSQQVTDRFSSITGVAATLTGDQIVALVSQPDNGGLLSITPDAPVQTSASPDAASGRRRSSGRSSRRARTTGGATATRTSRSNMPDDRDRRLRHPEPRRTSARGSLASVNLSSLPNNSPGDGRGHGTFVAGIAAGGRAGHHAAPNPAANLVSIDVMDDTGMGLTSDIIRACQWILDNKAKYNIRVANFSLHSTITAPFYIDPLDRAVEQLWFNGDRRRRGRRELRHRRRPERRRSTAPATIRS